MRSDQIPAPGKTKLINFPPSRSGKDVKCPGYARGGGMFKLRFDWYIKDVCAHCYCASLVRTLFIRHALSRHVFQARAPGQNSTKYRADTLCVNLVCKCFCWKLGDPHFFFATSLHFLILSVVLKNKKNLYVGSFNYFSLCYSHEVEFVHGYRCA